MRGNPNPKPFAPGTRGTKPKICGDEETKIFPALFSMSQHAFIKKCGGATLLRKLVREEMEKTSQIEIS